MEKEYSNEVKGRVHAYRFDKWEKKLIAKALLPEIKKLNKKIQAVDNHPDNEGQVTFLEEKRMLRREIKLIQEIIEEFS